MWKNLPKIATQWNSGATRDSNRGRRARIPSALTTRPLTYRLENMASAACVSFHRNATLTNFALLFWFLYVTFGLWENLLSDGCRRTHPHTRLCDVSFLTNLRSYVVCSSSLPVFKSSIKNIDLTYTLFGKM